MLNKNEKIILTGESIVNGISVEGYQAQIDSENPENMTFSSWQNNKEMYKENRTICRSDKAEFEDYAYNRQDELIAMKEKAEEE